jgi:hypothetical protein
MNIGISVDFRRVTRVFEGLVNSTFVLWCIRGVGLEVRYSFTEALYERTSAFGCVEFFEMEEDGKKVIQ